MISKVKKYHLHEAIYIIVSFIILTLIYFMRENFQGDFPLLRGFWASILFGLLVAVFELYIAPKNYDRLSFAKLFF